MKFSGIIRSVESGEFLRYKVDINRNLRLMDFSGFLKYGVDISGNLRLSGFFKFWFRVRVVFYKAFLFVTGGGK